MALTACTERDGTTRTLTIYLIDRLKTLVMLLHGIAQGQTTSV